MHIPIYTHACLHDYVCIFVGAFAIIGGGGLGPHICLCDIYYGARAVVACICRVDKSGPMAQAWGRLSNTRSLVPKTAASHLPVTGPLSVTC